MFTGIETYPILRKHFHYRITTRRVGGKEEGKEGEGVFTSQLYIIPGVVIEDPQIF